MSMLFYFLSIFQNSENLFQDAQYFSDSEHHLISGGMSSHHRQDMRRMRNRTLTGLETMRLVEQLRPGSATGSRPITPSFNNDKDMLMAQQFIDFNPAGEVKLHTGNTKRTGNCRL